MAANRSSLSINVQASLPGPRPLQLVNTPIANSPRRAYTPTPESPALPTPVSTTSSSAERAQRNARRQSSISYNPSPRGSPLAPLSPQMTPSEVSPSREPTLMELHSSLLAQIAQREERSMELKIMLKANEEELDALKRKWAQLVLASAPAPSTPLTSPTTPGHPASGHNPGQPMPIPNIADPFYGLSSTSLDALRDRAKKLISSIATVSAPPQSSPLSGPPLESPRSQLRDVRKRKGHRENRDSSSSSGSSVLFSSPGSLSTDVTSSDSDEERKDCSDAHAAASSSLGRSSSLNSSARRRRSTQSSSPLASNSPTPSSIVQGQTPKTPSWKRNSIASSASLPGLGFAGILGELFGPGSPEPLSPLTSRPKRQSVTMLPSASRNSPSPLSGQSRSDRASLSSGSPSDAKTNPKGVGKRPNSEWDW